MKLISHRGNITGRIPAKENKKSYILKALEAGYDVEIDVRYIGDKWFLGHDEPDEEVDIKFLEKEGIWVHCKNIEAIANLHKNPNINCFWHQKDSVTLTSFGFLWAYPGKQPIANSVAVLPEIYNDDLSQCFGVCSDYIGDFKK